MSNNNRRNSSNNNYKRRSNQYNKNYQGSNKKNYEKEQKKVSQDSSSDFKQKKNYHTSSEEKFNITKQQTFDFDEMRFSDDLDTSFVDNKRKKKKQIVDDLAESYEREKKQDEKKRRSRRSPIRTGRVVVVFCFLVLLLALLVVCVYIVFRPVPKKVVTKEKEVVVIDDNYLFLGDSITELYDLDKYFPDMNVVNSGISGNQTKNILDNMKERAYRYNPSKVFLLIGTNDIQAGVSEDEIIDNIEKILENLQENRPYAKLYLEAIYPVDEDKKGSQTRTNEEIQSINQSLEEYCKKEKITFIDTYDLLLDADSEEDRLHDDYTKDGLHLTDEGYEVITKELMKYIK